MSYTNVSGDLFMAHKNPGNFANNKKRARDAGRKGGKVSPGNFKFDHERASAAGRLGGSSRRNVEI